jgi:hypothetical protein
MGTLCVGGRRPAWAVWMANAKERVGKAFILGELAKLKLELNLTHPDTNCAKSRPKKALLFRAHILLTLFIKGL